MNQILISEKMYLTPEIKRKKVFFKMEFILSIFLVCMLSSYCIYAEYDRNKNEEKSKEILAEIQFQKKEEVEKKLETVVVVLNSAFSNVQEINISEPEVEETVQIPEAQQTVTSNGEIYSTIGIIDIPSIDVHYPILQVEDINDVENAIKIAPCKFWGPNLNQVGNFCIVGHNYWDTRFFSQVPTLQIGDLIELTDLFGNVVRYSVYSKYQVIPEDISCLDQETGGKTEITLITCTQDSKERVIVKARKI